MPRPLKLHLGAGPVALPGWLNTDYGLGSDYFLDARKPWPVPPLDYVFADNVFEHFSLAELREVLAACASAMAPGGKIRICVPDVERNARMYLDGGPDAEAVLARHRASGYEAAYPQELLRVVFALNDHHLGFQHDFASLARELRAAGFTDVTRVRVGESTDPVLRGLEQRSSAVEDLFQLTVEAVWPKA